MTEYLIHDEILISELDKIKEMAVKCMEQYISLQEKHISDVYSYLMGINNTVPLYFYYIHLTLGAIINSAQSENYDNCNVWVNELLAVIKEPEVIEMPITSKMYLLKSFTMICHSENIKRLDELHSVIARLKEIPDPEAKEMYGS